MLFFKPSLSSLTLSQKVISIMKNIQYIIYAVFKSQNVSKIRLSYTYLQGRQLNTQAQD